MTNAQNCLGLSGLLLSRKSTNIGSCCATATVQSVSSDHQRNWDVNSSLAFNEAFDSVQQRKVRVNDGPLHKSTAQATHEALCHTQLSVKSVIRSIAPCRLRGVMRPWFDFWFWCLYTVCVFISYASLITYAFFFTFSLLNFSFGNRPAPFPGRMS